MKISSLYVRNYRNYTSAFVEFGDGLNVLEGPNASGKTNILEAVYLLGVGKSARTSQEKELVRIGEEKAYVKAVVQKKFRRHTIEMQIEQGGKKILIDGIPALRAAQLVGILNVVLFSPDEMKIVKESPAERRKFMDIGISQQSGQYFRTLVRYNKILKQKNKLLKEDVKNPDIDGMLDVWDMQLAEASARLIYMRKAFLKELEPVAAGLHAEITGKEVLRLWYESDVDGESIREITANQLERYRSDREKEKEAGYTQSGAHRDDVLIEINGNDARKIASQGQQRTAALSIILAQLDIFKKQTGETPVLLLDDVLSELDEARCRKLIEKTQGVQTLLTCTEYTVKNPIPKKTFRIENGSVK